jgi:hypothetical protein
LHPKQVTSSIEKAKAFWKNSTWHTKQTKMRKERKEKRKKNFCYAAAAKTKWKGEKKSPPLQF